MNVIGIDIGGTKLAAAFADASGRIFQKSVRPTNSNRGPDAVLRDVINMARRLSKKEGTEPIGVSFGGPYDVETGRVGDVPNMPGWKDLPLREALSSAFPGRKIVIDNDANAAALAEWKLGAGRGFQNIVYLTMGTGIGAGAIVNGRLLRGQSNAAGEIGHICLVPDGPVCGCGKRGCLEAFCSGPAAARRARDKLALGMADDGLLQNAGIDLNALKMEHLVIEAQNGNRFALAHLEETAMYMAWGVASLANVLSPEIALLGTVAVAAGDLLLKPLREHLKRFVFPAIGEQLRIEPAGLGELVGDHAAAALALYAD
ncbi:MAG: ROK family protein [Candidatus Poribacteria bacterium]|nr:ROK family protein [Candidatus Poribacteria bacterium]